ncbi:mini-ribonuclease 3 isoform X2 [Phoenix dactylifera]|uniref:Mini-ribonuclease 3 isoform X2 n=1 Tax=Phoenix dactylifera TaxID=42345 RepID=A0A8B7CSU2_PHODC|nr:mini-ribonuclease 3 isoform X2 [Phoenix dactylifera]
MAMTAMAYARVGVLVRASWDTNPSPKPLHIPKPPKPARLPTPPTTTGPPAMARTAVLDRDEKLPSAPLISRSAGPQIEKSDEQYLGYERWWLPVAPKVKKPRSIYNAASLAYLGDCIYELYARRHFLYPPLSINEYNERVMKVVCCEAQDILFKKLLDDDYLTEEERDILRWGKNVVTSKSRTTKRAGVAVYNRASSLETLVGYLYLTDAKRLEELMFRLGFSTGASSDFIAEELRMNLRVHYNPWQKN